VTDDAQSATVSYVTGPRELWIAHVRLLRFQPKSCLATTGYAIVVATVILLFYRPSVLRWLLLEIAYVAVIWVVVFLATYVRFWHDRDRSSNSLTADPSGLSIATAHSQGRYEWGAFDQVRSLRNGVAIRVSQRRNWWWISANWFRSEDEFQRFRKILIDGIEVSKRLAA
jgi:hypothetical protein